MHFLGEEGWQLMGGLQSCWMAFRRFTGRQLLLPRFGSFPERVRAISRGKSSLPISKLTEIPIEKTAIFRRLKAERCNCRFRSPMILFVSLVNLCLHWLNFWPARISGRQIERMISFDRIPKLKFVRSKFNCKLIRFSGFCQWIF